MAIISLLKVYGHYASLKQPTQQNFTHYADVNSILSQFESRL